MGLRFARWGEEYPPRLAPAERKRDVQYPVSAALLQHWVHGQAEALPLDFCVSSQQQSAIPVCIDIGLMEMLYEFIVPVSKVEPGRVVEYVSLQL